MEAETQFAEDEVSDPAVYLSLVYEPQTTYRGQCKTIPCAAVRGNNGGDGDSAGGHNLSACLAAATAATSGVAAASDMMFLGAVAAVASGITPPTSLMTPVAACVIPLK